MPFSESTGFFLEIIYTGIKVANVATVIAIPSINDADIGPNVKSLNDKNNFKAIYWFKYSTIAIAPIKAITNAIKAIDNDSAKNILNTSFPLAPTALNTPISWLFDEIETVIKLNNNIAANIAKTIPV